MKKAHRARGGSYSVGFTINSFVVCFVICASVDFVYATEDGASIVANERRTSFYNNEGAVSITRHYQGDLFILKPSEAEQNLQSPPCECGNGSFRVGPPKDCQCQCLKDKPTLRDDTLECISDIHECMLAEFVSSTQAEKIPYVYIPSNGQLLHPTAEIALLGLNHGDSELVSPICIVTRGQFLTTNGWQDIRNDSSSFEAPFRLYPDSGKTYLQWTGDPAEKLAAQGRVILVQLLCRDAAKPKRTLFHPCVSFRIAGSPNTEELFYSHEAVSKSEKVLSTGESLAIGLVLGGLVLAYILVSLFYYRIKNNNADAIKSNNSAKQAEEGTVGGASRNFLKRNNRKDDPTSAASISGNKVKSLPKTSLVSSEDDSECEDIEDLSKMARSSRMKQDNGSYTNAVVHDEEEIYSTASSDEENEGRRLRLERINMELKSQQGNENDNDDIKYEISPSSFGISVAETLGTTVSGARSLGVVDPSSDQDGDDDASSDENGTPNKKKLYFNPSYFEPENLQSPPPAAVEFLSKIREMISVAKDKMQNKAFQPSLIDIPEDDYSSQASRAPSTTSNARASSRQTCIMDDLEESKENNKEPLYTDLDEITTSNNDTRKDAESDLNANTLKRLSQRVNTHGQTLVSEIVQTLDLKPRLPDCYYNPYPMTFKSDPIPIISVQTPVNATTVNPIKSEPVFPELVKPSMLRHALNKDIKKSSDTANIFENFRQEMRATLSKVKSISPISTLNRSKSLKPFPSDANESRIPEQGENKVQKWLQSLDGKNNPYSKIYDAVKGVSGSKQSSDKLEENSDKPRIPARTVSFSYPKQPLSLLSSEKDSLESIDNRSVSMTDVQCSAKSAASVFRSQSLYGDSLLQSSPLRRQRIPSLDENKNYTMAGAGESVNDYINSALTKVPTLGFYDSDSILSDNQSKYKDSLEYNNLTNGKSTAPYQHLDSNEELRSYIETPPLSILKETNVNTNGTGMYGNPFHSDPEISQENSYEEIHFGTNSLKSKIPAAMKISEERLKNDTTAMKTNDERIKEETAALKINDERVKKHKQEIRVGVEATEDDETKCSLRSMYSNPDSLVSEIHISGDKIHSSDNRLSIELTDDPLSSESDNQESAISSGKKKKKTKIKRNDSILQDSLERPKIKKKLRNESFKGEERGKNAESTSKEGEGSPISNSLSLKDDSTPVRRSKTMRTFKDYKTITFSGKSVIGNQLSLVGEGIHFTYRTPSPETSLLSLRKPPLPPKQQKNYEENQNSLESSITSSEGIAPSIPPKHKLRYSASLSSDLHRKPLPIQTALPDEAPKLPPKIKHRNSFSDSTGHFLEQPELRKIPNDEGEPPPKLPEKSRKVKEGLLSTISSRSSIPELTEEEANSILNGVLAHSPSCDSSISESIYSQGPNFLDRGNIAIESDDTSLGGNVPDNLTNFDSQDEEEENKKNAEMGSNNIELETTVDEASESPEFREEVVRGQFILSNSRPPTLHRHRSFNQESSVIDQLKEISADLKPFEKGFDGTLALKIKAELEKHFIEKSGADSIKRAWRKVLEKVDSNEKFTLKDIQKYILSLKSGQLDLKSAKNYDSGYHSNTDSSSDSSKIRHNSKLSEPPRTFSLKSALRRSGTISIPSELKKKTTNLFQRSSSLQQLIPSTLDVTLLMKDPFKFNRSKLTASMERSKDVNPRLSLYVNNSFPVCDS